ncbi:type II toxin-antitoxin system RatA family toxin [Endozoicomonadaceae bacterium StTr2]
MTTINRSALVMHSAQNMYALVSDVERYTEFLEGCTEARILKQEGDLVEARLTVVRAGIERSFMTRNTMTEGVSIEMNLLDGPLGNLSGRWDFKPLGDDACKVSLSLSFSLGGGVSEAAVGKIVDQTANNMVDTFCKRADVLFN